MIDIEFWVERRRFFELHATSLKPRVPSINVIAYKSDDDAVGIRGLFALADADEGPVTNAIDSAFSLIESER